MLLYTEYDICGREVNATKVAHYPPRTGPRARASPRQNSDAEAANPSQARRRQQHASNLLDEHNNDVIAEKSRYTVAKTALIGGSCVFVSLALSVFGVVLVKQHYKRRRERSKRETCHFALPRARSRASSSATGVSLDDIPEPQHDKKITFVTKK